MLVYAEIIFDFQHWTHTIGSLIIQMYDPAAICTFQMQMPRTFFPVNILIDEFSSVFLCVFLNNSLKKHFIYVSVKRTQTDSIAYICKPGNFLDGKLFIAMLLKKLYKQLSLPCWILFQAIHLRLYAVMIIIAPKQNYVNVKVAF